MKESVLSFEEKTKNLGLPTLKLPASTTWVTYLSVFLCKNAHHFGGINKYIGPSSVVYIFLKDIIS